jgi:hypothetical protein
MSKIRYVTIRTAPPDENGDGQVTGDKNHNNDRREQLKCLTYPVQIISRVKVHCQIVTDPKTQGYLTSHMFSQAEPPTIFLQTVLVLSEVFSGFLKNVKVRMIS